MPDNLETWLDQLENAQLIRRLSDQDLAYLFKHALIQESAFQSLLLKKRREIHRRVAESIERVYADRLDEYAALLARHYAEASDDAKRLEYATRAGDVAARIYANAEARWYYDDALVALSRLPDTDDNRRHRLETMTKQVALTLFFENPERNLARLAEVESLAQDLSGFDPLPLARVHYWMGRLHAYRNEMAEAISYYRQVLAVAKESGEEQLLGVSSAQIGRLNFIQGRYGEAVPPLSQSLASLERTGNWPEWILATAILGVCLAAQGHYAAGLVEGERALSRALELNELFGIAGSHLLRAQIYLHGGDMPKMLEEATAGLVEAAKTGNQLQVYMAYLYKAWSESRLGKHAAASASITQTKAMHTSLGGHLIFDDSLAAADAEIKLNAGRVDEAVTLAEDAVRYAQSVGGIFAEGEAQRVWGQALALSNPPRYDETEAHFEESLRLFESDDTRLEAARTHVAWGKILQEAGKADTAREHFQKAVPQFEASGLVPELERTRGFLAQLG